MKNNCSVKCFSFPLPNLTRTIPEIMQEEVEMPSRCYFIALHSVYTILLNYMARGSPLPPKFFKTALSCSITNSLAVNVNLLTCMAKFD